MHITIHTSQTWADTFISELNDTHVEAELRTRNIPPLVRPPTGAGQHGLVRLAEMSDHVRAWHLCAAWQLLRLLWCGTVLSPPAASRCQFCLASLPLHASAALLRCATGIQRTFLSSMVPLHCMVPLPRTCSLGPA
jgi:hypothetical protein